jgi:chorismate mutase/prephenate dehydrogenase
VTAAEDVVLAALRERVTETDRAIVELVNARLELVAEIKRHKAATGRDFLDPDRERWLIAHLQATSRGSLSDQGVEELVHEILDLVKRELTAREGEGVPRGSEPRDAEAAAG